MNKEELEHYLKPETFIDEAFARLKSDYPWITKDDLDPETVFDIEKDNDSYRYVFYHINNDGSRQEDFSITYVLEEKDGDFSLVYRFMGRDGEMIESQFDPDEFYIDIYYYHEKYLLQSDRAKFPYGYDINVYCDKAFEILKNKLPWLTKDDLDPAYRYAIEKVDGQYEYIEYYAHNDGTISRNVMTFWQGMSVKVFNRCFIDNHETYAMQNNGIIDKCSLPTDGIVDPGGWQLEKYVIQKHKRGDYSLFAQAGDRNTGSSTTIIIPRSCFEVDNFDDFLNRYFETLPSFGMPRETLFNSQKFREFFGF